MTATSGHTTPQSTHFFNMVRKLREVRDAQELQRKPQKRHVAHGDNNETAAYNMRLQEVLPTRRDSGVKGSGPTVLMLIAPAPQYWTGIPDGICVDI